MRANKLFPFLILLVLLLAALPVATVATPAQQDPGDKVEPLVLEEIATAGRTDFFVWLTEKADLSPAEHLRTKLEKGRFVYETLVATAERTQKGLRTALDRQGVRYQAFYIANKVLVYGGSEALVWQLAGRPDVARVSANREFQLEKPLDPVLAPDHAEMVEPHVTFIKAPQVWALGYTGQGTVLAGLDTGIDKDHPTIAPHYRGCLNPPACTQWDHNYNWWDATDTYPLAPYDGLYHGTATTGAMVGDDGGANQIGVAPGAQTIHCKMLRDDRTTSYMIVSECYQWSLAPWDLAGANPRPDLAPDVASGYGYSSPGDPYFEDEIAALQAAGILITSNIDNSGPGCGTLAAPGSYRQVLTVGGVDHATPYPGTLWTGSSRGPSPLYPNDYFPDIMAPSVNIRVAYPGGQYIIASGTSAGGHQAAGVVGLLWSANPALRGNVALTQQIIKDTATPLTGQGGSNCGGDYTTGPNNDWGYGTIDALAAVQAALAIGGAGFLQGHVNDTGSDDPIPGATVWAHRDGAGVRQSTDAAGYYTMTALAGTYTVTAGAFGYLSATVSGITIFTGTTTTQDITLTALPVYVISGTVSDSSTGEPLSATLTALRTPLPPVASDPSTGFYSLSLPLGTYTFRLESGGYYPLTRSVVVDSNQTQDFDLAAWPSYVVSGTVVEARSGLPLSATVTVNNTSIPPAQTDPATGFYSLTVPQGVYTLVARASGHTPQDRLVSVYGNQIRDFQLDLPRCILLVDDDQDQPDVRAYYASTLDTLGYAYTIWNLAAAGNPTTADLQGSGVVIWFTGQPLWNQIFNSANEAAVAAYLDGGGSFFLSSQEYLRIGLTPFGQNYLGISTYTQDVNQYSVVGNAGNPIGDGLGPYYLSNPPGWTYLSTDDVEGIQSPFRWQSTDHNNSTNYDGGSFKTVFFAWPLEGLYHNPSARAAILGRIVEWFGGCPCETAVPSFTWSPPVPLVGQWVYFYGTAWGSPPFTYTWDLGDGTTAGGDFVGHPYSQPGAYTVVLTVTNCATATATVAHTITVVAPCAAVEAVAVAGPALLRTGETGLYSATYTPLTATTPVTLTWDYGATGPTAAYSWTTPGDHTITVTATNGCSEVQDTFVVAVCQDVGAVAIAGPARLQIGEMGLYSATYTPLTATAPVTLIWDNGTVGASAVYSWPLPGSYTVAVTATNACGVAAEQLAVAVNPYRIYLPLIVRGW